MIIHYFIVLFRIQPRLRNSNKSFQPLKECRNLFLNYFSDTEHIGEYSSAAIILCSNFEIIVGMIHGPQIKLLQTDVDEG